MRVLIPLLTVYQKESHFENFTKMNNLRYKGYNHEKQCYIFDIDPLDFTVLALKYPEVKAKVCTS